MRANYVGHGPGKAAPEAAASVRAAGAGSAAAVAVAPAGLNAQKESAPAAQAAQSRDQIERGNSATDAGPVRFSVTRWGLVLELRDIAAVRAFAEQVGASHA